MKKKLSYIFYFIAICFLTLYIGTEIGQNISLSEMGRLFFLCGSCLFLYFGGFFLSKYRNDSKPMRINLWIFFILYLVLFLTLTLFDPMWGRNGLSIVHWNHELFQNYIHRSFNIVPFKTIFNYIKHFNGLIPTQTIMYNLLGNFVCLMPFSFFMLLLFPKQKKRKRFLVTAILFILLIELLQFITLSGSSDIDDVILNVTGALVMYQILKIETLNHFIRNVFLLEKNKVNKKTLFLIILVFIFTFIIVIGTIKYRQKLYNKNLDDYTSKYNYAIEIIDDTEICAQALEPFYEDELFIYSFPCIKSDHVYALIEGKKYLVKDLLNHNPTEYVVTIERLQNAGLNFITEEKYPSISIQGNDQETIDIEIQNETILEAKYRSIFYDEETMKTKLYLVPKQEGITTLNINYKNMQTDKITRIQKYNVRVDHELNVTYEIN